MENLISFINDPNNTLILYAIAAVLIVMSLLPMILSSRGSSGSVQVGDDDPGAVITGQVKGDVSVDEQSQPSKSSGFDTIVKTLPKENDTSS